MKNPSCYDCYRPAGVMVVTTDGPLNMCMFHFNKKYPHKRAAAASRLRGGKIVGEFYTTRLNEIETEIRRLKTKWTKKYQSPFKT